MDNIGQYWFSQCNFYVMLTNKDACNNQLSKHLIGMNHQTYVEN